MFKGEFFSTTLRDHNHDHQTVATVWWCQEGTSPTRVMAHDPKRKKKAQYGFIKETWAHKNFQVVKM